MLKHSLLAGMWQCQGTVRGVRGQGEGRQALNLCRCSGTGERELWAGPYLKHLFVLVELWFGFYPDFTFSENSHSFINHVLCPSEAPNNASVPGITPEQCIHSVKVLVLRQQLIFWSGHKHRTETLTFDMMNVAQTPRKDQPVLREKRTLHPDPGRWRSVPRRREEGTPEKGTTQPT